MATKQGDVGLLDDPVAQDLLQSSLPAQLAYIWPDGTPRVVPIWFYWNGEAFVLGTFPDTPKLKALMEQPKVALTINTDTWPYKVLLVRGIAQVESVEGIVPEYATAAQRYFGEEQGKAWVEQLSGMFSHTFRVTIRPDWVGIHDMEKRFPAFIENAS